MAATNPGFVIAKKHAPQAWGFDQLSALTFPFAAVTDDGGGFDTYGTVIVPQACKVAKVSIVADNTSALTGSVINIIVGTQEFTYTTNDGLAVGPADNSAVYGYPTVFAPMTVASFGSTALFASAITLPSTGTYYNQSFVPDICETIYNTGTPLTLVVENAGDGTTLYVSLLVQYLDVHIASNNSNPTAW